MQALLDNAMANLQNAECQTDQMKCEDVSTAFGNYFWPAGSC